MIDTLQSRAFLLWKDSLCLIKFNSHLVESKKCSLLLFILEIWDDASGFHFSIHTIFIIWSSF
ncbi:unnamed protein product [Coffea canephora]|uniref:Uncharacterized protein n=1 Tax=Coffea canephora TaxID=49390 RepID=A0A068UVB8_COFCA|nr:unnamed protein product [Coffea canephora]